MYEEILKPGVNAQFDPMLPMLHRATVPQPEDNMAHFGFVVSCKRYVLTLLLSLVLMLHANWLNLVGRSPANSKGFKGAFHQNSMFDK